MSKSSLIGFRASTVCSMPEAEPGPRREPVIVPVLDPEMVPVRDPVIVPVLLVREPVIVPPNVTADTARMSTVVSRNCPERFMTFLLVN
jgi:hypothetical protein